MKKILQVVSCLEKGGTEAFIMNNYHNINLKEYSFDFLVFVKQNSPYDEEIRSLGGNIYYCGLPEIGKLVSFVKNIVRCIKDNGPYNAVHSHVNIANAWVMFAAKLAGVPIIISHSHDTSGKETTNIIKKAYIKLEEYLIKKCASVYLACSVAAGNYLYGEEFFKKNGNVLCNGIDVNTFIKSSDNAVKLKEEFDICGKYVFGNITRFEEKKNITFVVEVFYEILKLKSDSVLILGGVDGGLLETVKEQVHKLNISDKVRFIGTRNDVPDCLKLIDTYLFPSLYEGLGIVLLEAQASKVSCFASGGVSREADMGLGLVEFLELSEGSEFWAKKICEKTDYDKPSEEQIIKAFSNKGYYIKDTVKKLEAVYGGKACE